MGVSSLTGKIVCFFFIFSLFGFVFCFCFCFGVFFVCCLIFFCIHVSFYYFGFICVKNILNFAFLFVSFVIFAAYDGIYSTIK